MHKTNIRDTIKVNIVSIVVFQRSMENCSVNCLSEKEVERMMMMFPLLTVLCYSVSETNLCFRHNPCQNGGTCKTDGNNIACQCAPGYLGSHCERKNSNSLKA